MVITLSVEISLLLVNIERDTEPKNRQKEAGLLQGCFFKPANQLRREQLFVVRGAVHGPAPPGMSASVRIGEGAVVCDGSAAKPPYHHDGAAGATLSGDITIGPETVVFPGARIRCCEGAGPVVIGRGCVLEEGARLVNVSPGEMRVGDGNLFEVGCTVNAQQVGRFTPLQP